MKYVLLWHKYLRRIFIFLMHKITKVLDLYKPWSYCQIPTQHIASRSLSSNGVGTLFVSTRYSIDKVSYKKVLEWQLYDENYIFSRQGISENRLILQRSYLQVQLMFEDPFRSHMSSSLSCSGSPSARRYVDDADCLKHRTSTIQSVVFLPALSLRTLL